jgi:hypothetical protein
MHSSAGLEVNGLGSIGVPTSMQGAACRVWRGNRLAGGGGGGQQGGTIEVNRGGHSLCDRAQLHPRFQDLVVLLRWS